MAFLKTKIPLWTLFAVLVLFVGGVIAAAAFGAISVVGMGSFFGSSSEEHNSQVVKSIERKEEVVLVQLGIEGIKDKENDSKIGDFTIPWSEKAVFLRYSFDAKLGIDGKKVDIEPQGDNAYVITIPEFIFIGVDHEKAEIAVEQKNGLSWATPEIDDQKLRNDILNDKAKAQHLEDHTELLQDQAKAFYSNIIHAVDPDAELAFVFADQPSSEK